MTLSQKCRLWLEAARRQHVTDYTFDLLSAQLANNYDKLPKWFQKQVPQENLSMGSTLGLDIHDGT